MAGKFKNQSFRDVGFFLAFYLICWKMLKTDTFICEKWHFWEIFCLLWIMAIFDDEFGIPLKKYFLQNRMKEEFSFCLKQQFWWWYGGAFSREAAKVFPSSSSPNTWKTFVCIDRENLICFLFLSKLYFWRIV